MKRFSFLFTGDHTRVTLNTKEGGDYINANIIKVIVAITKIFNCRIVFVVGSTFPLTVENNCVLI